MAQSAKILATNALYQYVSQANAFSRGDIVRFDGANYVASQANNAANAVVIGMVSSIKTAGTEFYVTQVGEVYGLTTSPVNPVTAGYVAGTLYYLSDTNAGKLTATAPVGPSVSVPVFVATSATTGYMLGNYGSVAGGGGGSSMTWSMITANQTLAVANGYFVNGVGSLNLALPAVAIVGQEIIVWDVGGNGFTITQGAGQSIIAGTLTTTVGVGGSIQSTAKGNKIIINNWDSKHRICGRYIYDRWRFHYCDLKEFYMTITSPIGTQAQGRTLLGVASETADKGADYTILAADRSKLIRFTGAGPWTATLTTSATLGSQFVVYIRNDSALDLTIDTTTGNINGGPTVTVEPGLAVMVFCNGTDCFTFGYNLNPVPLIGGTMTGALILSGDPVTALGAATKQYVDAIASGIAVQPSCYAATTANLNATQAGAGAGATLTNAGAMAAFSVDGVSPPFK
jgi:hypothetical protein